MLSCNEYEVPHPNVRVNINVKDTRNETTDTPYKGVLRASDFSRSTSSFFFNETSESIRFDSSFTNNNGDLSFELPFVDGIPQRYYELTLSNDSETIEEGRFLNEYIQYDTCLLYTSPSPRDRG